MLIRFQGVLLRTREERRPSPWRDRPAAESLALFKDMRRGLVDEGAASLRCNPTSYFFNPKSRPGRRWRCHPQVKAGLLFWTCLFVLRCLVGLTQFFLPLSSASVIRTFCGCK